MVLPASETDFISFERRIELSPARIVRTVGIDGTVWWLGWTLGLAHGKKTGGTIYAVPSERFDNLAVVVAGAIK